MFIFTTQQQISTYIEDIIWLEDRQRDEENILYL